MFIDVVAAVDPFHKGLLLLPSFIVGDQTNENVNQWSHRGSLIKNHSADDDDIIFRWNKFDRPT